MRLHGTDPVRRLQVERSIERAAKMYAVEPRKIELAIDYFDYLKPNAA